MYNFIRGLNKFGIVAVFIGLLLQFIGFSTIGFCLMIVAILAVVLAAVLQVLSM